ncbi:hypothetical protein [Streptomyces sp. SID5910]|uniref:hypothetical protein n=1 Tax=Streptomyces sp. SID5910 TaxID=2690312 RepID=UPI0013706D23|nr:hypothetical protein [Streptomyces sp. SID5910]MYR46109.1 hypothetical protein [Streptomyces sp. SID5910]
MQRKGGRRRNAGEPDVEAVLDELYATPPPDFVSRREERAAAARTAGRAQDARRIRAARRPTRAAWAANLLLRSRPEESRRFLELGQALREAHRTLDAAGLKELSAQRRSVVSALSRQAAQLAGETGHQLSEAARQEVESTLRAVLADPDAADRWAEGRLENSLTPPSEFPAGPAVTLRAADSSSARQPSRPAAKRAPADTRAKDELAERRRKRQEELTRAQEAAEAAERRADELRAARTDTEEALRRAHDAHDRAQQQVTGAEQQLRSAQAELEHTERERLEAEERDRAAGDALAGAEREARETARHRERLTARVR